MEGVNSKLIKHENYEVHSIFSIEIYERLIGGIQLAECMKSEVSYIADTSDGMCTLYCMHNMIYSIIPPSIW